MVIKVGDRIRYRGAFGGGPEEVVTVEGIERTPYGSREKYGVACVEVNLDENDACVDLSNGCWAYSDQIVGVVG